MRELTKSMMSYGWAMSVFGAQQMFNLMTPGQGGDPCDKAAKAFNDVTQATSETLDNPLKAAFNDGNKMQAGMVDMMLGGFMSAGMDPGRWMRAGNDAMQQMTNLGKRAAQAAGPTSPSPEDGPASGTTQTAPSSSGWGPMAHH